MKGKKGSSVWIGVVLLIVLAAIGAGVYFLIPKTAETFPQTIGEFSLTGREVQGNSCADVGTHPDTRRLGLTGELCKEGLQLRYSSNNQVIFVNLAKITKGMDLFKTLYLNTSRTEQIKGYNIFRMENHELFWFTSRTYDLVLLQEAVQKTSANGEISYVYGTATGNNPVFDWFINKYPVKAVK